MLDEAEASKDGPLKESEKSIGRFEHCRACGGPMSRIETTYCYSNLLVRELATLGIKVVHQMDGSE